MVRSTVAGAKGGNSPGRGVLAPFITQAGESKHLVDHLKGKDTQAVDEVVHAYTGQLYRAALGAGFPEAEARDVVQVTIETFLKKLDHFEGRSKVRTWLFGILYKKISEARRGLAKRSREEDIDEVFEARFSENGTWVRPPVNPEDFVQGTETLGAIQGCLQELPEVHRQAFYLKEVEGFSTPEICNILAITATHLGVILYRARNRLRDCIEHKGITRG